MRIKGISLVFSLLIFSIHFILASSVSDSLHLRLSELSKDDIKSRIDIHNSLAWDYRDVRPDSSLYHANIALNLSRTNGFDHREIQSINYIGVAYRNLSNFSKAFEKYLEALKLSEERTDNEQRGYSLINLGNLYLYQTNFQGAIRYFIQALDQAQVLADQRMVAYCYLNLGRSYKGIDEFGQAELYFKQAVEIRKDQGDLDGQLAAEIDLAEVYMHKGDLDISLNYYFELIKRIKASDNPRLLAVAYNQIAHIYLKKGQLELAESNALTAIEIAREVNSRYEQKNILENLSNIYNTGINYEKAYQYHVQFAELNQQLFSEENIRRIEQMKNQYRIEQQEVENDFLRRRTELNEEIINRQQVIITLTVLGVLLFLVIAVVYIRGYLITKRLSNEIQDQNDKIQKDKGLIEQQSNKLKELDAAKSRFFANVSHDLRTPLSLIIGNLEMMKDDEGVFLTNGAAKNLDTGLKNCKRLLYLTDEINDLTKLEEGKIDLNLEVVRLGSYLKMLSEMFVGTAEYKGVVLEYVSTLNKTDAILIDPRQFEKIFYNLISNAVRHTSSGQSISIEASRKGDKIVLSIKDTGSGIASDSLPYIFDRFYQSDVNDYRAREGLGIGLALVKELVELHKGTIKVESTMGLGTTFEMEFKRVRQPLDEGLAPSSFDYVTERKHLYDSIDQEQNAGISVPKSEDMPTILLVDDHPEIRYHIRQIVEDDYHVIEAAHGIEAMELLKKHEVSLIISDLMMPMMDGFELIEAINNNEEYCKIPLLVVSARISDSDQEKVLFKGINDYLQKPFQKKELILRIGNLLQQKQKWENSQDGSNNLFNKSTQSNLEKDILAKLEQVVMEKIDNENLSVLDLGDALAASERQVYRLVKKITGLTPFEYVSEVRMKYVEYLIRKGKVKNASEAARSIGLKNVTTFSRQFEKKFGVKPSEVLKHQS